MSTVVSKDFTIARELWGSGVRVFSEFNTADFVLTRLYYQAASAYKPLAISTPDYQYKLAFLVSEVETKRDGYGVWFTRTYATVPTTRTEGREILYTFPGQSGIFYTSAVGITATGVGLAFYGGQALGPQKGWSKYAYGAPSTVYRNALVTISYSIGQPVVTAPFTITFGIPTRDTSGALGVSGTVDFVGTVFTPDGSTLLGVTSPNQLPPIFTVSDTARRWKGNIWERELVTVVK